MEAAISGARAVSDSSTTRILGVLGLFTIEQPVWTVDMLVERLGLARATVYRYVKTLSDAGFLVQASRGGYVLGPRFVEIDRQIRLGDPLLRVAPPIIDELRDVVNGAQLLCRFYANRVLTVLQDRTDESISSQMERGRPFPLFRGSPSRVILAYLPNYRLRNLMLNYPRDIAEAGLGESWSEFRRKLKAIRNVGYCVGSDLDPTLVGISAPIFREDKAVVASLCLVRRREKASDEDIRMLGELAVNAANRITAGIQNQGES